MESREGVKTHVEPAQSSRSRLGVQLQLVHSPEELDRRTGTDIDIIAIHGLDTKSPDTWTYKCGDHENDGHDVNCGHGVNWLVDKAMLPRIVGNARIFTCDWPAELFNKPKTKQNTLRELSLLLLEGIKQGLSIQSSRARKNRPIFFIASCLGGIILISALGMAVGEYSPIQTATRGIVFLATPFRGTSFEDVANWAEPGLKAWAYCRHFKITNLLELAREPSDQLSELKRGLHDLYERRRYIVSSFYEKETTNIFQRSPRPFRWLFKWHQAKLLVNKESATLDFDRHPLPLNRCHVKMNKFPNISDADYKLVSGRIRDMLEKIREGSPLQQADAYIREKHYTEDRLKIERLDGNGLAMEQCYINLAIVQQPKAIGQNRGSQSSPSSLPTRLEIEAPTKGLRIQLAELFAPRTLPGGHQERPRRILIRGRAGFGKTTLCKKIVHDFIHHDLWKDLFARVLWVPLRKLKQRNYTAYNLEEMFSHVFFGLLPNRKDHVQALCDAVDNPCSDSLFILDGLDEVSELLNSDHQACDFLMSLLNRTNVIITARPHAIIPHGFTSDLELETVGFDQDQVQKYLDSVIRDQSKVNEIKVLLRRCLFRSLVRIPIQLDALCLLWDTDPGGNNDIGDNSTMTKIYTGIMDKLWRKDICRLEKSIGSSVDTAMPSQVRHVTKVERGILQYFAFSGMVSKVVDFQERHRNALFEELICSNVPELKASLDEVLGRVSFLRTSETPADRSKQRTQSYHFLHLTFQDYFAAEYFAQQWEAGEDLIYLHFNEMKSTHSRITIAPDEFLQRKKYKSRYNILWRFTAGLLHRESVPGFMRAIGREPLDLLGPAHRQFVIHLLKEADMSADPILRSELEGSLSEWLLFEYEVRKSESAFATMDFPNNALFTALTTGNVDQRRFILSSLWLCDLQLSDKVITVIFELLRGTDRDIREGAARSLAVQSNLPGTAITTLKNLLSDEADPTVQEAAAIALGSSVSFLDKAVAEKCIRLAMRLPKESVKPIMDLLDNPAWTVEISPAWTVEFSPRRYTAEYRLKVSSSSTNLINLLKNPVSHIRKAACDALKYPPISLSDPDFKALVDLLYDPDHRFSRPAASILAYRSDLPGYAVAALIDYSKRTGFYLGSFLDDQNMQIQYSDAEIKAMLDQLLDSNETISKRARSLLKGQSHLPEFAVAALIGLLNDETNANVRRRVARILRRQSRLSESALSDLLKLLNGTSDDVATNAAMVFRGQSYLPESVIATLAELLHDGTAGKNTVRALGGQSDLPDTIVKALVGLLKEQACDFKETVLDVLGCKEDLPDFAVTGLVELFNQNDSVLSHAVVDVLKCQHNLPDFAIKALIDFLGKTNSQVGVDAEDCLRGQDSPTDQAIVSHVEMSSTDLDSIQHYVGKVLSYQRKSVFRFLGFRERSSPELEESADAAVFTSDPQSVGFLYRFLLDSRFYFQPILYIRKEAGGYTLLIDEAEGVWTANLKDPDGVLSAIEAARQRMNPKGYKLWN